MAIYIPNKNSNTENNNSNTDMHTGKIDEIISRIAELKAQPQSTERDAAIQRLSLQRNALLTENANSTGWY